MSSTAVEIPGYVAGTYTIDPGHSDVAFTVRHLMLSKVRGHFTRFQGELALAPDPLASSVTATLNRATSASAPTSPWTAAGWSSATASRSSSRSKPSSTHPSRPPNADHHLQEGTFDGGQARRPSAAARECCAGT
jgi:YceI-like domain